MRLFILTLLFVCQSWAQKEARITPVEGAQMVCSNKLADLQVSLNFSNGKIWVQSLSQKSTLGTEVQGAVYQGMLSTEKYTGEVLGEIIFENSTAVYVSIIVREVNGAPQMEYSVYEQNNSKNYLQVFLNSCQLK